MSAKQKMIIWPVVLSIVVVAATSVFFASTRSGHGADSMAGIGNPTTASTSVVPANAKSVTETANLAVAQGASVRGPVQNVRFTLYDVGIFPREIHVRSGVVALAIEDRTGQTSGLMIEREGGMGVGQVRRFSDHWRGRGQFRFEAGRYRVFDATRPANQAKLIVEP